MPSGQVSDHPALILSTSPLPVAIQNTGSQVIFIAADNTVAADTNNLFIAPFVSFEWPPLTPLWAICNPGQVSVLAYSPTGAHIGSASPYTPLSPVNYLPADQKNTVYFANLSLVVGVYTATVVSTTVATIKFFDASNNLIATLVTSNGTGTVNLGTNAILVEYYVDTGAAITITLQLSGAHIPYYAGSFYLDLSGLDSANTLI